MTDGGYAAGAVLASAVAGAASRPLLLVFNELGLVMAIMGAAGGATFVLALRVPWGQALRPVILGAFLGFGLSAVAVALVKSQLGIDLVGAGSGVEIMAAVCFILGMAQERIVARLTGKGQTNERDKPDAP